MVACTTLSCCVREKDVKMSLEVEEKGGSSEYRRRELPKERHR